MGKYEKLLIKILDGTSDSNIRFIPLTRLLLKLGFKERVKGSHHIFYNYRIEEIINIQAVEGKAKAYQVKQIRDIITKYGLNL